MKKTLIVLGVIVLIFLAYLYSQNSENSNKEQEINDSGRAKAIDTEKDLWKIYEDKNAELTIKYPHNINFGEKEGGNPYTLIIKSNNVNGLEGTMGYNEDTALKNMELLKDGEYGQSVDFPLASSKKVNRLKGVNAQDFMVLARFEVCDVTFERKLYFFNNNHQIIITLIGEKDEFIQNAPEYFETNLENCGDEMIWNFDKQEQFYQDLSQRKGVKIIQEWFDVFDEVISTIKFIDAKTRADFIQGVWTSVDDPNSVIKFEGGTRVDLYKGKEISQGVFELKEGDGYLDVTMEGEVFEYKIEELSNEALVLIYLPRGNILRYKK